MENYDVAIIGGGVTGAAAAYLLSRYQLRVVVLEKMPEVGFGVSKANSGIVHGGFHYPADKTLKGKLEIQGNLLFGRWSHDLDFPFVQCGILVAAFSPEQLPEIRRLYEQGVANRVPGIELCSRERMQQLEPKLPPSICGGLYAPGGGVVEPYSYVFALIRQAKANGAEVKCNFKALSAEYVAGTWHVTSETGETVEADRVVNAAGLYADEVSAAFGAEKFKIIPRKGEEYLLNRTSPARPAHVIFPVPDQHSKGVLVIPTAGGTTMIGPTSEIVEDKNDTSTSDVNRKKIFSLAQQMISGISARDLITSFSGSRPTMEGHEDFFIERSEKVPAFIQAAGMLSPGLTASPAVAERIVSLLKLDGLLLVEKKELAPLPRPIPSLRNVSPEKADALHADDPAWTNIICRCEKVSEAEIRLAIRAGHTTLDGIKFATRAGMGGCQGGFCTLKIMHLISEETGMPLEKIIKGSRHSFVTAGRLGEEETK